jgi:hypothetical protein
MNIVPIILLIIALVILLSACDKAPAQERQTVSACQQAADFQAMRKAVYLECKP